MGRNAEWLSEKQVEILEWIKDGCPSSGLEDDSGRRITARALQRRGLITVKGHGASWAASITKAGLAWQASHPEAKLGDAQVDELIPRVLAADGRLELPEGRDVETTHKELVRMSDHSPSRPTGWRLELAQTWHGHEPPRAIPPDPRAVEFRDEVRAASHGRSVPGRLAGQSMAMMNASADTPSSVRATLRHAGCPTSRSAR